MIRQPIHLAGSWWGSFIQHEIHALGGRINAGVVFSADDMVIALKEDGIGDRARFMDFYDTLTCEEKSRISFGNIRYVRTQ